MLLPIGQVNDLPVTVLRASQDPPLVLSGHLFYFDGRTFQIRLEPEQELPVEGEQLLLDFGEGSAGRRRIRILEIDGREISVQPLGRPRRSDRRDFPRIEGIVSLKYQLLDADDTDGLNAWIEHPHLIEAGGVWKSTDPFMEFSATGLSFRSPDYIEPGSLMRLKFKLRAFRDRTLTCGASVRRCELDDEGFFNCAIAFVGLSGEVREALMEYTRHCQDVVLGLDSQVDDQEI